MAVTALFAPLLFSILLPATQAVQLQISLPALNNAHIQGCLSVANNASGSPVIVHDCSTETFNQRDWTLTLPGRHSSDPQQIKIFGDKCLDVTNGVNATGTKLQIWQCTPGNTNQLWIAGTDNSLQWVGTDKCADLTNGVVTDGNQVQIWTCDTNNPNQKWAGEPNPNLRTGVALIEGGPFDPNGAGQACVAALSDTNGAGVILGGCLETQKEVNWPNGSDQWDLPVFPLIGQIKIFSNKCLDVTNGNNVNGNKVQVWECANGNTNQMWEALPGSQIKWSGTTKCLDLTNGNGTLGNALQIWDCDANAANPNQNWNIQRI